MQSYAIAYTCMLIVGLLPYVATVIAKSGHKGFDNRDPRTWLAAQEGYRKRANFAQMNAFEALPLFLAAVLVNAVVGSPAQTVNLLALFFVAMRVLHLLFYLADKSTLRSLAFVSGLLTDIALFVIALSNVK